jgi:uncharacterized sulfatase
LESDATRRLVGRLEHEDSAVRYWAAMGLLMRGGEAVRAGHNELTAMLKDPAEAPRIIAAEALGRYGNDADAESALQVLIELAPMDKTSLYTSMLALNAIDAMGTRAMPVKEQVALLPTTRPGLSGKLQGYVPNLIQSIAANLDTPAGR